MDRVDILGSHIKPSKRRASIYYWSPVDSKGFSKWMAKARLDMTTMKKMLAQLLIYSKTGLPRRNREKFRHVDGKICELKPTSQIRLLGFEDGSDFIIVATDVKKTNKLSLQCIDRAKKLREMYYEKQ